MSDDEDERPLPRVRGGRLARMSTRTIVMIALFIAVVLTLLLSILFSG